MVRPSIFFETEKLQRNRKIVLNDLIMGHSSNSLLITPGCILKQHWALKTPNYLVVKCHIFCMAELVNFNARTNTTTIKMAG